MSSISWANAPLRHDPFVFTPEHGTATMASRGCTCVMCTRIRALTTRARRRAEDAPRRKTRTLEVLCWCEAKVVRVAEDEVRAGITRSCADPVCRGLGWAHKHAREAAAKQRKAAA